MDVIISTGGRLDGPRRNARAVEPLFEKRMDGFAALFLIVSHATIGTSAIPDARHRRGRRHPKTIFAESARPVTSVERSTRANAQHHDGQSVNGG